MAAEILGAGITPAARNASPDVDTGGAVLSQAGYSAKTSAGENVSVSVLLRRAPSAEAASAIFMASKRNFQGEDIQMLGGVVAYRTTTPPQLNLLLGRDWLIISAGVFPHADIERQERVARQVLQQRSSADGGS